jgi:DNA-binding response OmpR family regulator
MAAKILVVDDDPNIREMLGIHLRNAGYEVHTAKDGIEGGYGLLKHRPHLVIVDVNMPHMDGLELVAALRADSEVSRTRVLLLSTDEAAQTRGKDLGVVCYLTKPVRADRLLEIVATSLKN